MRRTFTLLILLLLGITASYGATSSLIFTAKCNGSGTSDDDKYWIITSDGAESNFDNVCGIHYGTNSASVSYIQLETTDFGSKTISEVTVNARDAQEKATITVKVGGTSYTCSGSNTATNTSADYTFTGSSSGKIVVAVDRKSQMKKAIYVKSVIVTYEDGSSIETVATPSFSPAGGTYTSAQHVSISCATNGATIYYTTNGNAPTTSSTQYSGPIDVSSTTTIKAIAAKSGMSNSAVAEATYTINLPSSGTTYEWATSINAGDVGKRFVLVYEGDEYVMTGIASGNYGTYEAITISSHRFVDSNSTALPLTLGGETDAWTFQTPDGKYLNWSSGNSLSLSDNVSSNSQWIVRFNNSILNLKNKADSLRMIKFNTLSPRFACYTSGQQLIQLYREVEAAGAHTVTLPSGLTGGTVTSNSLRPGNTANEGETVVLTVSAETGYGLESLSYTPTGGSATTITPVNGVYSFTMPASDVTVAASFGLVNYTISTSMPQGCSSLTTSPSGTATYGTTVAVSATASTGYALRAITVNGVAIEPVNGAYTFTMPASDVTVAAVMNPPLAINTAVVPSGAGEVWVLGGTTVIDNVSTATEGTTVTVKLHTNMNWVVDGISVTDSESHQVSTQLTNTESDGNTYTFVMPTTAVTVTGQFHEYHAPLYLLGTANGKSWSPSDGVEMPYADGQYSATVYFAGTSGDGAYGFFSFAEGLTGNWDTLVRYGATSDQFTAYSGGDDNGTATVQGGSNAFKVPAGIYTLAVNEAKTQLTLTPAEITLTLTPSGTSSVEVGQTVTIGSNLTELLQNINSNLSATISYSTMGAEVQSGSGTSFTLNEPGITTATATAAYEYISATASATYTVTAVNNSNRYQLVTNANQIVAGKKYLIGNAAGTAVLGAITSGNIGSAITENLTCANGVITLESNCAATPLTLGGSEGAWTFHNGNGYIAYTSTETSQNNYLWLVENATDNGAIWAITTSLLPSNNALITNVYNTSRRLQFNSNSNSYRFCGYASDQSAVALYVQTIEEVKAFRVNYATVTGGSAEGSTGANADEVVTVTVSPGNDYTCNGLTVTTDDPNHPTLTASGSGNSYTFTVPNDFAGTTITVTPSFVAAYAITPVALPDEGGTVAVQERAAENETVTVTVTPDSSKDYATTGVAITLTGNGDEVATSDNGDGTYTFTMPAAPVTVTATFEKVQHSIAVTSEHGQVTGLPATSTSGTRLTMTVTPNAGYVVSGVSGTFNNGNNALTITDNQDGTWSFSMPPYDVDITVSYFVSKAYKLLTDVSKIDEHKTYLLVGGEAGSTAKSYVMGAIATGQGSGVALTAASYDSEADIINSTQAMTVVSFEKGTGANTGHYAIKAAGGYLINGVSNTNDLSYSTTPAYVDITQGDDSKVTIQLVDNAEHGTLSHNTQGHMWKYYAQNHASNYIYEEVALSLAEIIQKGTVGHDYVIANQLQVVHANGASLWCKDLGNASVAKTERLDNQVDYMSQAQGLGANHEWDQSNWVELQFPYEGEEPSSNLLYELGTYVGQVIEPATVTARLNSKLNYSMTVKSGNELQTTTGDTFTPNVYCPANFLKKNLTLPEQTPGTFYFVNPKVQEKVIITYAVWMTDSHTFVMPAKSADGKTNVYDFDGAIDVEWDYNQTGNAIDGLDANGVDQAYRFEAIVRRVEGSDYGPSYGPRREPGKPGQTPEAGLVIYPTNLNPLNETQIITAIPEVRTVRTVGEVEYYNVAGTRSSQPHEGINIVVTRYTDGTISTTKMVK
ncbi:MAG: chitobiase/beta-hexosaminidase C-terminal domain-containing protein [Muribaculaceae bacterium]|nr:chitobiase/beta-hexosaminidase C-terminal domain-containing protein [Muribaculaceae bacterium]